MSDQLEALEVAVRADQLMLLLGPPGENAAHSFVSAPTANNHDFPYDVWNQSTLVHNLLNNGESTATASMMNENIHMVPPSDALQHSRNWQDHHTGPAGPPGIG